MSRYATTPCSTCGAPVVFASVLHPDGALREIRTKEMFK